MIFGNPYKFAISIDIVKDWSCNGFVAGFFYIIIDGHFFPKGVINTTLNSEVYHLFNRQTSALITKPINEKLFNEETSKCFSELFDLTFPPNMDKDNDYLYYADLTEIADNNCYIFAVSNGKYTRIIGSCITDKIIYEITLENVELDLIFSELKNFYENKIVPYAKISAQKPLK